MQHICIVLKAVQAATSFINGTEALISYIGNSSNNVFFQKKEQSLKFCILYFIVEPFSSVSLDLGGVEGENI